MPLDSLQKRSKRNAKLAHSIWGPQLIRRRGAAKSLSKSLRSIFRVPGRQRCVSGRLWPKIKLAFWVFYCMDTSFKQSTKRLIKCKIIPMDRHAIHTQSISWERQRQAQTAAEREAATKYERNMFINMHIWHAIINFRSLQLRTVRYFYHFSPQQLSSLSLCNKDDAKTSASSSSCTCVENEKWEELHTLIYYFQKTWKVFKNHFDFFAFFLKNI